MSFSPLNLRRAPEYLLRDPQDDPPIDILSSWTPRKSQGSVLNGSMEDEAATAERRRLRNETEKKRREAKDTVAAAESRRLCNEVLKKQRAGNGAATAECRRLRNEAQKKWRARRTNNEAAKVENQRLRNEADKKRRADNGTAAAETRRLRSKAEKKWRTRRTDNLAATAESRRQHKGQHTADQTFMNLSEEMTKLKCNGSVPPSVSKTYVFVYITCQ